MQQSTLTLSPQYQVTIPLWVRKTLELKPKQQMVAIVSNLSGQKSITLVPKIKSIATHSLGLGKNAWSGVNIDQYLKKERKTWK